MEFHISRKSREKYLFDQTIFSLNGDVVLGNLSAAREMADKINKERPSAEHISGSQIYAMGLLDEIFHLLIRYYRKTVSPNVFSEALSFLDKNLSPETVDRTLLQFCNLFPPLEVYNQQISAESYLTGKTGTSSNREDTLEEMLLLWVENQNPATKKFSELFDHSELNNSSLYLEVIQALLNFLQNQPPIKPENLSLIDMILLPIRLHPDSLEEQLQYILDHWKNILGNWITRLLRTLDYIHEEFRVRSAGPGPVAGPAIRKAPGEPDLGEHYSADRPWMNDLVLIAKNSYVWLDQLSKKYHRSITQLDQIPDEELNTLRDYGITGLWLIGVWERSRASERIKKICGNAEAAASAYSILDYRIAGDLGGETALLNLRERAWQRGIRLASDMVPNHYGIDSPWVINHPDWFIQVPASPYPAYTFNGPDLSSDPRVGIYLEDHYYTRTDAAVVFKYHDHRTGQDRFIYHGNDGTTMPWNDTAQLNYLNPEVREHILQTILEVSRLFPIIRFDAAMTLVKQHIQRLWFPEPGSGGAIPSRSEFGMTREEFNRLMPEEFWRQVVERSRMEQPETLLLAEAFWMMEGFFVRSLGMHRVYNSAFMNMLRDEKNGEYRKIIKTSLEEDPQILKRFVNFMNNPDERTAADQFGKGDKYFGVFTLMAALPGLPMIGHGQIEGFLEKYGMEYRRSYLDEQPDLEFVNRHQREIFPLLQNRRIFSSVSAFRLFDFFLPDGHVDENVYAFTNDGEKVRSLVIYNNRYERTSGWVRMSSATRNPGLNTVWQTSLADSLGLHATEDSFCILVDARTGMEEIHPSQEIFSRGLFFELNGYENRVFFPIREVINSPSSPYQLICKMLGGKPVPSIDELMQEYAPKSHQELIQSVLIAGYQVDWSSILSRKMNPPAISTFRSAFDRLIRHLFNGDESAAKSAAGHFENLINQLADFPLKVDHFFLPDSSHLAEIQSIFSEIYQENEILRLLVPAWLVETSLKKNLNSPISHDEILSGIQQVGSQLNVVDSTIVKAQSYLQAGWHFSQQKGQVSSQEMKEIIESFMQPISNDTNKGALSYHKNQSLLLGLDWLCLTTILTEIGDGELSSGKITEDLLRFWYCHSILEKENQPDPPGEDQ